MAALKTTRACFATPPITSGNVFDPEDWQSKKVTQEAMSKTLISGGYVVTLDRERTVYPEGYVLSMMQQQDFWAETFKMVEKKIAEDRVIDASIANDAAKRLDAERPFG